MGPGKVEFFPMDKYIELAKKLGMENAKLHNIKRYFL